MAKLHEQAASQNCTVAGTFNIPVAKLEQLMRKEEPAGPAPPPRAPAADAESSDDDDLLIEEVPLDAAAAAKIRAEAAADDSSDDDLLIEEVPIDVAAAAKIRAEADEGARRASADEAASACEFCGRGGAKARCRWARAVSSLSVSSTRVLRRACENGGPPRRLPP